MAKRVKGRTETGRESGMDLPQAKHVTLTSEQLKAVFAEIDTSSIAGINAHAVGIIAIFRQIVPNFEQCTLVNPRLFKIPKWQYEEIFRRCRKQAGADGVLYWMDKGPGQFEEAQCHD